MPERFRQPANERIDQIIWKRRAIREDFQSSEGSCLPTVDHGRTFVVLSPCSLAPSPSFAGYLALQMRSTVNYQTPCSIWPRTSRTRFFPDEVAIIEIGVAKSSARTGVPNHRIACSRFPMTSTILSMMGSTAVPPCPSAVTGTNTFFPMPFTAAFHFARSGGIRPPGAYLFHNTASRRWPRCRRLVNRSAVARPMVFNLKCKKLVDGVKRGLVIRYNLQPRPA